VDAYRWVDDASAVDYDELSHLYRIAPLGEKHPTRSPPELPSS
jgi:hypothetical protein